MPRGACSITCASHTIALSTLIPTHLVNLRCTGQSGRHMGPAESPAPHLHRGASQQVPDRPLCFCVELHILWNKFNIYVYLFVLHRGDPQQVPDRPICFMSNSLKLWSKFKRYIGLFCTGEIHNRYQTDHFVFVSNYLKLWSKFKRCMFVCFVQVRSPTGTRQTTFVFTSNYLKVWGKLKRLII